MRPLVLLTAGLMLVSGCGGLADTQAADGQSNQRPAVDKIAGARVGTMAERQLELMHPGLAVGRTTCPDLVLALGRTVRCRRVAELSGGRLIRVFGTVSVVSLENGGRLHVRLDDDVAAFGVTGSHLAAQLTSTLRARRARVTAVRCPYLPGRAGTAVRCRVRAAGRLVRVPVVVVDVDPETNLTRYRFDWRKLPDAPQRSLAYVATEPSAVVDYPGDHRSRAAA